MTWSKKGSEDRPSQSSEKRPSKPKRSYSSSSAPKPKASVSEYSRDARLSFLVKRITSRVKLHSESQL